MSVYTDIEAAVTSMFEADATVAGMTKTIEANLRDCLFSGTGYAQGFRAQELPALQVSTSLDPVKDQPFNVGETQALIPLTVVAVTVARTKKESHDSALTLQREVARLLNGLRKSANALGMQNTLIFGELSSSTTTFADGVNWYGQSTTQAVITKILPVP